MGKRRNDKLLKKIALRIKQLREEKAITQEVFYYDTGINIGRLERMKRDPSLTTLDVICKYLDLTLEEFFKGV